MITIPERPITFARNQCSAWAGIRSHDAYRQAHSALKFLYAVTLKRTFDLPCIPRRRRPHPLPDVLSGSEVRRLLEAFRSPKYRLIAMTLYGAGLRVSEACRLRPGDIDSLRMLIHVREGKGRKDRFVTLSPRLLDALRVYWRVNRPPDFLFPGKGMEGHGRKQSKRTKPLSVYGEGIGDATLDRSNVPGDCRLRKPRVCRMASLKRGVTCGGGSVMRCTGPRCRSRAHTSTSTTPSRVVAKLRGVRLARVTKSPRAERSRA